MKHVLLPRLRRVLLALGAACFALPPAFAHGVCVGDCDGNGTVTINELITGVNITLGAEPITACEAFDCDGTGTVPIQCLIQGVNNALDGCGGTTCPLDPGTYTLTGVSGGSLRVATLSPIPFPPGATVVAEIGPGDPSCVHDVVVPFPGGFHSPTLCITAFGFSVSLTQTGCGIGQVASEGGGDFTVEEIGDTSDHSSTCNLPQQVCTSGQDSAVRIQVTVGDGTPDTCTSGSANAIVSIPEHAVVWIDASKTCPAMDGTYDPDKGDVLIAEFDQILDLTTDTNSTKWMDLDGDGCSLAGVGPAAGYSNTGMCADLTSDTVGLAASGTIGSKGAPLFDITYSAFLPFAFSGPSAATGATCDSPPVIDFNGTANQCISTQ